MINLCKEACEEFLNLGFTKDVDPRSLKESYNIIKQPDGLWYKSTKPSLHEAAVLKTLNLEAMPQLKVLTDKIDEIDDDIRKNGGRIFISENIVYKIKKGTHTTLLSFENIEMAEGKYRKLCDEFIEHGLERDRFRSEETYMLTKTSANEWSTTSSHENYSGTKTILNVQKMIVFKAIATKINNADLKFQVNGGRVFITPTRIYRLNNKVEVVLKV